VDSKAPFQTVWPHLSGVPGLFFAAKLTICTANPACQLEKSRPAKVRQSGIVERRLTSRRVLAKREGEGERERGRERERERGREGERERARARPCLEEGVEGERESERGRGRHHTPRSPKPKTSRRLVRKKERLIE